MKVGIVGLPQSGKTTVFNALTGAHGEVGGFHGAGEVAVAVLKVPDERLDYLVGLFRPERAVAASIEFEDITGGFSQRGGTDRDAQALAAMRGTDALLMVLRCFENPSVPHVEGSVNAVRDLHTMMDELLLADLAVIENRIRTLQKGIKRPSPERDRQKAELALLERCSEAVESGQGILSVRMTAEEEKMLRSYAFLTLKPSLCLLNVGEGEPGGGTDALRLQSLEPPPITMCGKLEMEIMELEPQDRQPFMEDLGIDELVSDRVVRACYELMGLRSFFTYAGRDVRAWTVRAGEDALAAAGKIHSDMARGFIRAEVVAFDDLKECGSIQQARLQGKVRLEGKDYQVQDGDVITFRFGM